jgi:hypothetical protein
VPTTGGKSRYKLLASGFPEGGPGLDYVAFVFVSLGIVIIRPSCKLTLSDQAQITLQIQVSLSDTIFAAPSHFVCTKFFFFLLPEPKPAVGGHESNSYNSPGFYLTDWVIPTRFSTNALDLRFDYTRVSMVTIGLGSCVIALQQIVHSHGWISTVILVTMTLGLLLKSQPR